MFVEISSVNVIHLLRPNQEQLRTIRPLAGIEPVTPARIPVQRSNQLTTESSCRELVVRERSLSITLANKLQKLKNRAARVLTSSNYDTNAEYLIEKLSWKNLESQRKIAKAIMVYKSLNGFVPDYLTEMFVDRSSVTNYTLRDTSRKLALSQPRTNYLKNSFSYSGSVLWNSLPVELRQSNSLRKFKSDCSNFIH